MERLCFTKTKLPGGWLGNMSPYPILWEGDQYRTSEAVFQAMRFADPADREAIRNEVSPMGAKFKAKALRSEGKSRLLTLEEDLHNMRICVGLKLEQHPELVGLLIATGDLIITEDVTSRMSKPGNNLIWGAGLGHDGWVGDNWLGLIWMEYREGLKA